MNKTIILLIFIFSNTFSFAQQNQFEWIIEPHYDDIRYSSGYYFTEQNNKVGLIDSVGKVLFYPLFDEIKEYNQYGNNNDLFIVKLNNKYGLLDKNGKVIFQIEYDEITSFGFGSARIKQSGKYGLLDEAGNFLIPIKYDYISYDNRYNDSLIEIKVNNKYGFINKEEKIIIQPQFESCEEFNNGLFKVQFNGKYGFINAKGDFVIKPIYDWVDYFNNGFCKVQINDKLGLINSNGETIIQISYDWIEILKEGFEVKSNGKYGFANRMGQIIIQPEFDDIYDYSNYPVIKRNEKYGYINRDGKIILQPQFIDYHGFYGNIVLVKNIKDEWIYIDANGKTVFQSNYIFNNNSGFENNLAVFYDKKVNKYGYINKKGKIVIKAQFDDANRFEHGIAGIKQNNKYGCIDTLGNFVILPIYDNQIDYYSLKIDKMGNIVHLTECDDFFILDQDLFQTIVKDSSGFTNNSGSFYIKPQFDIYRVITHLGGQPNKIVPYEINYSLSAVRKNSKWGIIKLNKDKTPEIVWILPIDTIVNQKNISIKVKVLSDDKPVVDLTNNSRGFKPINEHSQTNNEYNFNLELSEGKNTITIEARDSKGTNKITKEIVYKPEINNPEMKGKYYALVVGNSDYQDKQIPSLEGNPLKDAQLFADILSQYYTFDKENITILKNATREQIISELENYQTKLKEEDNFLIFYAGHGQTKNKIGYWIPIDAKVSSTANWISNFDLVNDKFANIKAKHILVIADACFSGTITRSMPSTIEKQINLKSRNAMTSGNLETVPNESIFFEYLTKKLRMNEKKYISGLDIYNMFYQEVQKLTNTLPKYGDIPGIGDEGGDFIFIKR